MKKVILMLLTLCLLLTAGCRNNGDSRSTDTAAMGRYVETQVSLPQGIGQNDKIRLTKKEDMPFLYVLTEDKPCTITGYRMEKDGSWKEATPEWLKGIKENKDIYQFKIFEDAGGAQYLYFTEIINDSFKGILYRSTDQKNYETLHPEGWDKKNQYGIYPAPDNICALQDGMIAALFDSGTLSFYDNKTLKKQKSKSITGTRYGNTSLFSLEHSLFLVTVDDSYKTTGVDSYDLELDKKTSYPFKSDLAENSYLDANKKKDLIMCNTDGVHVLKKGTSIWQTVVDGTLTSLMMKTMWPIGFLANEADEYYVLYNTDNSGYSFMKYTFDKTIEALPSIELKLYALTDDSTMRQAVALFQQKHPEVRVHVTVEMTQDEYDAADATIKGDYVRTLNTQLLSGNGPDILMLTGLPAEAFAEKGVLADITDIIEPMLEKEELYPNIINSCKKDDKFFYVPARFALNLLCADTKEAKDLNSIAALADYKSEKKGKTLLGTMTVHDFITAFAPYFSEKIIDDNHNIDKTKLVTLLNQLKRIGDKSNLVEGYKPKERGSNIWELASEIQANVIKCSGFLDSMFPLGIVDYTKGSFTAFENSYIPLQEIGINNAGKNKELCKEFISLMLSQDIQKYDLYDGFSVNKKALSMISKNDMSKFQASSEIENADGSYSSIQFKQPSKEYLDKLVNSCSKVSVKAVNDEHITKILVEETEDFFLGSLTAEEAAENILQKLKAYLNE